MPFTYKLYDLVLEIPFPCRLLQPAQTGSVPDVIMREGPVLSSLPGAVTEGCGWQATPERFLFNGSLQAGRFLIEEGNRITLQRNPAAGDDLLSGHLLASVIVAVLRQRGHLILHANVIETPHGAVAISGASGAGKTTTQAALLARGCRMVADDVAVLRLREDGQVVALPGISKMNLCDDAALGFGHDIEQLQRNPLRIGKVWVPVDDDVMVSEPVPLQVIYLLNCHLGEGLHFTRLLGAEKFISLQDCIYGPQLPEEHPGMFPLVSALARQAEMIRVERPAHGDTLHEIIEAILQS